MTPIICKWLGLCALTIAQSGTLSGYARVHDGDTIRVQGQSVRLQGVDAEELDEPNGPAARDALIEIIGNDRVTCKWSGWSYNRVVGTCVTSHGIEINAEIIRRGFALDCAHYSGGKYHQIEPDGARRRLIQKPYC
ncbi:MAG TPA: thermonuclease family protein [Xanthobacteraceae bacterium]|nr:thermonuclease family protein [Xanthobacteraceae bacterium]